MLKGGEGNSSIVVFGGRAAEFCGMEVHSLRLLPANPRNQIRCQQHRPRTAEEQHAEQQAHDLLFARQKRANQIRDLLLEEKTKQVELLKARGGLEKQLLELRNVTDVLLEQKEEQLKRLADANDDKLRAVKRRLEALTCENLRRHITEVN